MSISTGGSILTLFWSLFCLQNPKQTEQIPGFVLRLVLDDATIKFEPTIEEFENVLLSMFDNMMKVVQTIPRIETRLYADWVS